MTLGRVLITGCSSGIGYAAAHGLSARGWTVYATCRNPDDVARLCHEGLDSFVLDVASSESIDTAMAEIAARGGVDVLYNNAAIAVPGAVEDLPRGALREVFETNLFGLHDLTRRVIPLMRAQGHGRIVNCSSVLGFVPANWRGAYVASKYALEGLTDCLRMELSDTPIKVVLLQPGPVTSRIRINARRGFETWIDWQSSPRAAQYRTVLLPRLYEDDGPDRFERPAEDVAALLHRILSDPAPRPRYRICVPTRIAATLRWLLPDRALDRIIRRGT